ncbi:MAG: ParB N-terminal domain-containing protein, partial [Pseudomonadota bacterium]
MDKPQLLRNAILNPDDVDASKRLRPVDETALQSLMASIDELGVMLDEIHVREVKEGRKKKLVLMAGGHRLEACRRSRVPVSAKVWRCGDEWAQLLEIDDNLASADLTALDTMIFLTERQKIYEKLHPETARGHAGAKTRWNPTDTVSVAFSTRA